MPPDITDDLAEGLTDNVAPSPDSGADADSPAFVPRLIVELEPALDTSSGATKVTSITQGELLNTAKVVVSNATVRSGIARFPLTGLAKGYYFIRMNGLASDPVPTRIDNQTRSWRQYVGRRLRSSVIGSIATPKYRLETYSSGQGCPPAVKYSDGTNARPRGNTFIIMKPAGGWLQVRYLDTARIILTHRHSGPHSFSSFILGPSNHGTSSMNCSGCHGNLNSHPASYGSIDEESGWCFKCHYGPVGPSAGFVRPGQ